MPYPSFNRILVNLKMSLKSFLFKQWHEVLSDEQLDVIFKKIIEFFDLSEKLNELNDMGLECKSKNPPVLRIRGLLMRPSDSNND